MKKSFLQFERILYTAKFFAKSLVHLQTLLYSRTTVYHGGMVAVAYELSDTRSWHLGILLGKIHRHLTNYHIIAFAAATEHILLCHIIVIAHLIQYIVYRQRMVVYLYGTLDNALGQTHVYIAVVDYGIGHQRVDDSFKITYTAVGRLCNKPDDIYRNLKSVTAALRAQDVHAELCIRLLELGCKPAFESCQQAVFHALQLNRRAVAGQNYLFAGTEKMVEYMEKGIKRTCCRRPLLYVVHYQHVNGLIEVYEVVGSVVAHGIGKLNLKKTCTDIKNSLFRIYLLTFHTDSVDIPS